MKILLGFPDSTATDTGGFVFEEASASVAPQRGDVITWTGRPGTFAVVGRLFALGENFSDEEIIVKLCRVAVSPEVDGKA